MYGTVLPTVKKGVPKEQSTDIAIGQQGWGYLNNSTWEEIANSGDEKGALPRPMAG